MSARPKTPVKVPKVVSSYTPSTQNPELRSHINARLLQEGHITKIHDTLLHTLHTTPQNWPTLIHTHALSLLRSGECVTFPELMAKVLEDIKHDTQLLKTKSPAQSKQNGSKKHLSSNTDDSDEERRKRRRNGVGENGEAAPSLALPKEVIDEGLRVTRQCLDAVCEPSYESQS